MPARIAAASITGYPPPGWALHLLPPTPPDAEAAFESADYVALPAGSFEQHSYHLPLATDSIEAEHLADELARTPPPIGVDLLFFDGEDYGREGDLQHYLLGSRRFVQDFP